MSLKHHYPDEGSWPFHEKGHKLSRQFREKSSKPLPNPKTCNTCNGVQWLSCTGNVELDCQDVQLEHIHNCPECTHAS